MSSILNRPETRTMVLFHVEDEDVADLINGELVVIPPNEPVELPEFIANAVVEHVGHTHGLVIVNKVKTKTGVTYDVDEAIPRAKEAIIRAEKLIIDTYVRSQLEDRIATGKPALPPNGRALELIKKRGINLSQSFGIRPIGYREVGENTPYGSAVNIAAHTANSDAMEAQNRILQEQNLALQAQNERLEGLLHAWGERFSKVEEVLDIGEPFVPKDVPTVPVPPPNVAPVKLKKQA